MSASTVTSYSTDTNRSPVDRGMVTRNEAIKIVEEYFAELKPRYESAEEALAETMFGFQKSEEEFIEPCINGPTEISVKYEVSTPRKILFLNVPKLAQKEWTLRSKEEVQTEVCAFYDLDSVRYQSRVGA